MTKTVTSKKRDSRKFLKTFFSDRKQVGAVAPSSRFLVNKMVGHIDFDATKVIGEFGPGTGVFTKEILKRGGKDLKLFSFELNEDFSELLKGEIKDDRLYLFNKSAEEIGNVLSANGSEKADVILSSLPLAVIPKETRERILYQAKSSLKENGIFLQYQYSLQSKNLVNDIFDNVSVQFVPINVPPAFVYKSVKN